MRQIVFHVNRDKPGADAVRQRLAALAASLGMSECGPGEQPEAVVVLGGDGTMLSAVHRFPGVPLGVPLLGLNLGSLGYLAGVEAPHFDNAMLALASGDYEVSRRTTLRVGDAVALNDVVVSRGVSGHAIQLELSVNGRMATRFSADGLVVATPTGSTAYSLAAGGPILLPDSESFAVTPICPHALASRPLVIPDTARLTVRARLRARGEKVAVFADGACVQQLGADDAVEIVRADVSVPLIQLRGYDPYEVLSRKLGWNGSAIK